jgi:hypothetical protein
MTLKRTVLQHDGVPPHFSHFSHAVKTYLDHNSPGSWIACGRLHLSLRSHHTSLDFYLWERLTDWCSSRNWKYDYALLHHILDNTTHINVKQDELM